MRHGMNDPILGPQRTDSEVLSLKGTPLAEGGSPVNRREHTRTIDGPQLIIHRVTEDTLGSPGD